MIPNFQMASNTRVLIIDNNDSFTFNLVQLVEESGLASVEVIPSEELDLEAIAGFEKILISPGPGLPSDFPRLMQAIERYGPEKDFLGICLGHQAIAVKYGGTLINLPTVNHGVTAGLHLIHRDLRLFHGVEEGSRVGLYHSWTVDPASLPASLEVTAISETGAVLAIRHKAFHLRGVQFHPESFMTPAGRQIIQNWLKIN